jgi:hypothetical protein
MQMRTTTPAPGQQQRPSTGTQGVGETLRHTASGVADAASTVAHRVEDAWDSASGGVRQGAEAVAHTAEDFWTGTTRLIRRYPVASVLVAFGAGCLCASMFSLPRWTDDVARRMSRSPM